MTKFMLPLLAAFALTIGTAAAQTTPASTASAQKEQGRHQHRSPEEKAKFHSQRMSKELGLTNDQTIKVQQILMARGQEMKAAHDQAPDAAKRDQMREQMKANHAKYDAQFKQVLTPEQYTKYTAMQADRMKHGHGGPDGGKFKAKDGKVKTKTTNG